MRDHYSLTRLYSMVDASLASLMGIRFSQIESQLVQLRALPLQSHHPVSCWECHQMVVPSTSSYLGDRVPLFVINVRESIT